MSNIVDYDEDRRREDGRTKRIKWDTHKKVVPIKPGLKGASKPSGPEHKYFDCLGYSEDGCKRVKCKYCPHELWSNNQRMRHHLVNNCQGQVPDEVKLELTLREGNFESARLKQLKRKVMKTQDKICGNIISGSHSMKSDGQSFKSGSHSMKSGSQSFKSDGHSGNSSITGSLPGGDSDEEEPIPDVEDEAATVAKLLKSILTPSRMKGNETSGQKTYSDEEFESITRDLTVKKMRMELELMQDQKRVIDKVISSLDSLTKAADLYIASKETDQGTQTTNLTVYTNDVGCDGESPLLTNHCDQIVTDGR